MSEYQYRCVCSYPAGPHLLHCLNWNGRQEERELARAAEQRQQQPASALCPLCDDKTDEAFGSLCSNCVESLHGEE